MRRMLFLCVTISVLPIHSHGAKLQLRLIQSQGTKTAFAKFPLTGNGLWLLRWQRGQLSTEISGPCCKHLPLEKAEPKLFLLPLELVVPHGDYLPEMDT